MVVVCGVSGETKIKRSWAARNGGCVKTVQRNSR